MDRPEVVDLGNGYTEDDLIFHDEKAAEPSLAFMLARMRHPEFPEPVGVFRAVDRPSYDEAVTYQMTSTKERFGEGDLKKLFNAGDTWTVK
jgi:2-oxoglutarate ferredoxin oxidoreductase subunit beta